MLAFGRPVAPQSVRDQDEAETEDDRDDARDRRRVVLVFGQNDERTVNATVATRMPMIQPTRNLRLVILAFADTRIKMAAIIAVGRRLCRQRGEESHR